MKIGFTGTQRGMTDQQKKDVLFYLIEGLNEGVRPDLGESEVEFHHGDCIGADKEAYDIAAELGYYIVCHPPKNPSKRAWTSCDEMAEEKDYLVRNRDVVDESEILIAAPGEREEQLRSGTWSTVRYARKTGKKIIMVLP